MKNGSVFNRKCQVQVNNHDNHNQEDELTSKDEYEEGPIPHPSVIKLAVLDVFANFCVTVGFAIVGSGVSETEKCMLPSYLI